MSNRQPTKNRYSESAEVIMEHVNRGPLPRLRLSGADELADRHTLQAVQTPGSAKLRQHSIDVSDLGVHSLQKRMALAKLGHAHPILLPIMLRLPPMNTPLAAPGTLTAAVISFGSWQIVRCRGSIRARRSDSAAESP